MNENQIEAEILRRGEIASQLFGWSSAHLAGFKRGVSEAMAVADKSSISIYSKDYGFDIDDIVSPSMETLLSGFMLASIGRYEAFKAVRSWHVDSNVPSEEGMISEAKFNYLSSNCNFDIDSISCEYVADFPLNDILGDRPASDWIRVLVDDHQSRLAEGYEGYTDLVLEKHESPYYIADRGEGLAPGVFDGFHRIGAALAVGDTNCAVVYVSSGPKPKAGISAGPSP